MLQKIYSKFIFGDEKGKKEIFCRLDIIYEDNYFFKENWKPYNVKTGIYNLSGIWINGNTGEAKKVETDDR